MKIKITLMALIFQPLVFSIPANAFNKCNYGSLLGKDVRSKFKIQSEGTFKQESANLVWSRCVLGQSWDGKQCLGKALKLNLDDINRHLVRYEQQAELKWRLPTSFELENLYYSICSSHSLKHILLPNFSAKYLWTSSKSSGLTPYYLNITNGYLGLCEQSKCKFNVLLVASTI
ncbi:DUF1566 domain-containing protein [Shewanella baltica]|uniref:Lcl domain-containing protein n=1 Tax=Shewanella baltica TaxID=62322 RepID=UPI003D095724